MGTNLIANYGFFPINAVTHDEDLTNPFGMAIIDNTLWVGNNFSGFITHYATNGVKLAPVHIGAFVSKPSPDLITWVTLINANIVGLPLDDNNILIALGVPVATFVEFRDYIQGILNLTITTITEQSSSAIFKVYNDYQNAVNPTQTKNDIIAAVAEFNAVDPESNGAPVVSVIGNPTLGFPVSWTPNAQPTQTFAAYLLAAAANSTIYGYSPLFKSNKGIGIVTVSREGVDAIFTGLAIANNNLYVTDIRSHSVYVFDNIFTQLSGYNFTDEDIVTPLPNGYVPYNIINIGGVLYIVYGKISASNDSIVKGPSHGYVSTFSTDGQFIQRLISGGNLNRPWSIIVAPPGFGGIAGKLLIGNQGDGRILVYETNGTFNNTLNDLVPTPFVFPGLNAISTDGTKVFVSSSNVDTYGFTNGLISSITSSMISN